jgi:hypothetical protein
VREFADERRQDVFFEFGCRRLSAGDILSSGNVPVGRSVFQIDLKLRRSLGFLSQTQAEPVLMKRECRGVDVRPLRLETLICSYR